MPQAIFAHRNRIAGRRLERYPTFNYYTEHLNAKIFSLEASFRNGFP